VTCTGQEMRFKAAPTCHSVEFGMTRQPRPLVMIISYDDKLVMNGKGFRRKR
jgi:hypothetical protein